MTNFLSMVTTSILEQLNDYQHNMVNDWQIENSDLPNTMPANTHDKVFAKFNKGKKKSTRISIPFTLSTPTNTHVAEHLLSHGNWSIKDYNTGVATRNVNNTTEEANISSILKHTGADKVNTSFDHTRVNYGMTKTKTHNTNLLTAFEKDPNRAPSGLQMIITRDPHEIAGMATDKKYKSCMQLPKFDGDENEGLNHDHIQYDLKHQNLAVYLNDADDNNIDNARSHIILKKYTNKDGHHIWRPTTMTHGDYVEGFHKAVAEFARANWPALPGSKYKLAPKLYKNTPLAIDPD